MSDVPVEFGGGTPAEQQANAAQDGAPQDQSPVPAPADQSILRDIETASETIALYTAIIGKRPEIVDPNDDLSGDGPILSISPHWPHKNRQLISFWFRRMSFHARKRFDEAIMRIAG